MKSHQGIVKCSDKVLEAASKLTLDEREALVEIVRNRQTAREIRSARREFQSGRSRAVSPDELMREILS